VTDIIASSDVSDREYRWTCSQKVLGKAIMEYMK